MDKALLLAAAVADVKKQVAELQNKANEIQKLEGPSGPQGDKGDQGPKGEQGDRGFDGKDGKDGKDGADGAAGVDGKDGISVVDAKVDFDGSLVLTLSDGKEIDAGKVSTEQVENVYAMLKNGSASLNELLPDQTEQAGNILATDGTNVYWATPSSGGAVTSVNSQTGAVVLTASDVGAEPADATILKDADIGVTVQAYDANLVSYATNGNTAYGWGNHASAGYLDSADIGVSVQPYNANLTTNNAVALITGDMMGFIDRTSTTLSFNESTRTFTITPTGATWSVYYRGDLLTITGSKSVVIPNTTGAYFVRLNPSTLVLEAYGPIPDFANDVVMCYIYWNATTGKALIVGDERHGSKRDTTWHSNQHLNLGTVWRSGGSLAYTLNDASAIQLNVGTPLLIADEDLVHTITNSASPTADYEQILSTAASLEVLYLDGTIYTSTTASTIPWVAGTTTARYNSVTAGSGSLVDAGEGKYITYWLLATNDIRRPVKLVMGRNAWDTVDAAYGEDFESYTLNFAEQVFMYQIVLKTSTGYANTPKVVIAAVRKILDRVPSSSSTYSAGEHGTLTGRESADQHPIGAITNLQTSLDAKQATLVSGTNIKTVNSTSLVGSGNVAVQETLVSGTNIKTVNSTSLLGSGDVAVQPTLVSGTNIKTINGATVLGSGDLVVSGSFSGGTLTSQLKLAAGTTSVGTAPLEFVAGPLNTTAEAGALEYEGIAFYGSVANSTRGAIPAEQIIVLTGTNTLTSQTAAQAIFDGGGGSATGAVTLPVGTYQYELSYGLTGMSATSGSFGFALGGTATKTFNFNAHASKVGTSLTTPMAVVSTFGTAAITTLVANSTGTVGRAFIKGIIRVTVAGTVIPQVSLTVAAAAVVQTNSYFKVSPIGNATVAQVGNWS